MVHLLKGNIVLNYSKLNSSNIDYICDASRNKLGKYTPGSNIKIISKEKMRVFEPQISFSLNLVI